ncbi:MAG: phenylacetate-CoA oxygenase subunit PaaC [Hyphomonadaceae bacterium]|jgi:ring-1,2-phenylacetyl-CoA epoxidase subunit PaaC|nr:phenylacetate-CoA oxygenase subunit PaaC [Hyphomonadaceae bacterium]
MTAAPAVKDPKGKRASAPVKADALFHYVLALADDALILGHRLSEWSGRAPMLEEDIALSNLGLDLIGQARLFYAYAGEIEGRGRDEDALAYLRDEHAYANLLLVEQPNGDFAVTMVRHLLYAAFVHPYVQALQQSRDVRLAEIAAKAVKEMAYHVRHASEWVIRLGDGTEVSHGRAQTALEELWMYTGEMFTLPESERRLLERGIAPDRMAIKPAWDATLDRVLAEARMQRPADRWMQTGGRAGRHTEHLGHLLAEMQVLNRAHPGAKW